MDQPDLTDIERERMILRQGITHSERHIRIMGVVSMTLGLILLLMIGAVAYYTVPLMLADGQEVEGTRFTGGTGAKLLIFGVYAAVAGIGFLSMLGGAMHIVTGKRFTPGIRLMLFLGSLLVAFGMLVRVFA